MGCALQRACARGISLPVTLDGSVSPREVPLCERDTQPAILAKSPDCVSMLSRRIPPSAAQSSSASLSLLLLADVPIVRRVIVPARGPAAGGERRAQAAKPG